MLPPTRRQLPVAACCVLHRTGPGAPARGGSGWSHSLARSEQFVFSLPCSPSRPAASKATMPRCRWNDFSSAIDQAAVRKVVERNPLGLVTRERGRARASDCGRTTGAAWDVREPKLLHIVPCGRSPKPVRLEPGSRLRHCTPARLLQADRAPVRSLTDTTARRIDHRSSRRRGAVREAIAAIASVKIAASQLRRSL